jgi:hypothetical protein
MTGVKELGFVDNPCAQKSAAVGDRVSTSLQQQQQQQQQQQRHLVYPGVDRIAGNQHSSMCNVPGQPH